MRVVLQPETEQVVLNWSKLTLITLILEKINRTALIKICYNLLFAHSIMSLLSCRVGMGGIRELLDGKIWEWDLSFRWEWEWCRWNGRESVRKICSRTPLLYIGWALMLVNGQSMFALQTRYSTSSSSSRAVNVSPCAQLRAVLWTCCVRTPAPALKHYWDVEVS